jgi:hypothetical protein
MIVRRSGEIICKVLGKCFERRDGGLEVGSAFFGE